MLGGLVKKKEGADLPLTVDSTSADENSAVVDEAPKLIVIEDPTGGSRVIRPAGNKFSPRPSAPSAGPQNSKSPPPLQLKIDPSTATSPASARARSPRAHSPSGIEAAKAAAGANKALQKAGSPVPKLKLPPKGKEAGPGFADLAHLEEGTEEGISARKAANNKYKSLSIRIENPAAPTTDAHAHPTAAPSGPPISARGTTATTPHSARSPMAQPSHSVFTPRRAVVTPVSAEVLSGDQIAVQVVTPKRAFATPKHKAIYEDQDNDPAWYDAVIESIEGDDLYLVTFTGYGNQEVVGLGDMMLPPGAAKDRSRSRSGERRKRSRSRSGERSRKRSRSRSRSRDRNGGDSLLGRNLMEMVMKKEREAVAAVGKDYAQRPASYKGSLSLKIDRYTARKKSRSASPRRSSGGGSSRRRSPSPPRRREPSRDRDRDRERSRPDSEQLRKLKERYGDAATRRDDDR